MGANECEQDVRERDELLGICGGVGDCVGLRGKLEGRACAPLGETYQSANSQTGSDAGHGTGADVACDAADGGQGAEDVGDVFVDLRVVVWVLVL